VPTWNIKRVFEPRVEGDGKRVLVDRLWPRGVSKEKHGDALWLKDIAPSSELRNWFDHRPERWVQFCSRYNAELDLKPALVAELRALRRRGRVTLLYSARDEDHNQAKALALYLEKVRLP